MHCVEQRYYGNISFLLTGNTAKPAGPLPQPTSKTVPFRSIYCFITCKYLAGLLSYTPNLFNKTSDALCRRLAMLNIIGYLSVPPQHDAYQRTSHHTQDFPRSNVDTLQLLTLQQCLDVLLSVREAIAGTHMV